MLLLLTALCTAPGGAPAQTTAHLERIATIPGDGFGWNAIRYVAARRGGGVLVIDRSVTTFFQFDRDGALVRSAGRAGEGPGEFKSIMRVGENAAGVWALDGNRPRASIFDSNLTFVRTIPLPAAVQWGTGTSSVSTMAITGAMTGAGTLLARAFFGEGMPPASWTQGRKSDGAYVVANTDGQVLRVLAWDEDLHNCGMSGTGSTKVSATVMIPFCVEQTFAYSPDGESVAFATDSFPATGRAVMSLLVVRASGDTVYNRSWEYPREAVPKALRASAQEVMEMNIAAVKMSGVTLNAAPLSQQFPAFDRLALSQDGQSWLTTPTATGVTLTRLSARGAIIDKFQLPKGNRAVASLQDVVWVESLSVDDVPSLVAYRVVR